MSNTLKVLDILGEISINLKAKGQKTLFCSSCFKDKNEIGNIENK